MSILQVVDRETHPIPEHASTSSKGGEHASGRGQEGHQGHSRRGARALQGGDAVGGQGRAYLAAIKESAAVPHLSRDREGDGNRQPNDVTNLRGVEEAGLNESSWETRLDTEGL